MVSIIVPIYNAAKYLPECIESLINQEYRDIEILLVDDGSTDASPAICCEYEKIDHRIRYIRKENGGVSSARNEGIRHAKGMYLTFVDSDDYLDRNIIGIAVELMNESNADMIGWNALIVNNDEKRKAKDIRFCQDDFADIQAALISNYTSECYCGDYIRAVWGKLLKSSVIHENNISFSEELYIGEDAVFLVEYMQHIQSAVLINEFGYYYRILQNSAVRRYKSDLYDQSIMQIRMLEKLAKNQSNEIIECSLCVLQWTLLHDLLDNISSSPQKKKDYSDIYKWYEYMRKSQIHRKANAPWAGKLVQIQMLLGTGVPTNVQIMLMKVYDTMKKIVGR